MKKDFFTALKELAEMAENAEVITFEILETEYGYDHAVELHQIFKDHLDHRI